MLNHKGLGKLPLYEAAYVIGPGGITWVKIFAGYVPQASQDPYPIKVYSVAKYIPHLSHFWKNVIFAIPT